MKDSKDKKPESLTDIAALFIVGPMKLCAEFAGCLYRTFLFFAFLAVVIFVGTIIYHVWWI